MMSDTGATVFVVDDDSSVRKSLGRLLGSCGYDVELFASADEFLQRLPCEGLGCLILDVQLSGLTGLDLQEKLAARHCTLPIVFITGHGDLTMRLRAVKAGASAFIMKPFREETLLQAVAQALVQSRNGKQTRNSKGRHS
ncbi:MAG: DNA-binding response regulator [Acidobacteria bacterium]|nr:MAG: DNA-binding response regulator [Acidobacteriota bacterium]